MMRLSEDGRETLKALEGFRAKAYIPVPGDRVTIGYGFTEGVKMGDTMTPEQADARLVTELDKYERAVWYGCTLKPNQKQFDAMTLMCFNIGTGGFAGSTVLKAHNRGDHQAAARAFGLWNKSGGKVYAGLTRRRALEAALYLTPGDDAVLPQAMPQEVDPESKPTQSPINQASVIAGATAALAAGKEVANAVGEFKASISTVGDWLIPALLVGVVALCIYVVIQRNKQRKEGWA